MITIPPIHGNNHKEVERKEAILTVTQEKKKSRGGKNNNLSRLLGEKKREFNILGRRSKTL